MLLLLLFLPLAMFGSVVPGNQFIPVEFPTGFGDLNSDFIIPEYTESNPPGSSGGLSSKDIEDIKNLLKAKSARLFFKDYLSVVYFLQYVIKESDITSPNTKRSYEALCANIAKQDPKTFIMRPIINSNTIPNTFFNKLLYALEHASNILWHDPKIGVDPNSFFSMTIDAMTRLNAFKLVTIRVPESELIPKSTSEFSPIIKRVPEPEPVITSNPETKSIITRVPEPDPVTTSNPENTNNTNSVLNRLKRALIFEWRTFNMTKYDYSDEQKREFRQNSFYISLVRGFFIGVVVIPVLYVTYKIESFLRYKIENFFNSKALLFK
jgi:hypothetical protein